MKKRKAKKTAVKKRKVKKTKPTNGRRKVHDPNAAYKVFWAGTNYEVRNTSGKKTYGPYSTKEAATEAANLLNRMVPKSSLFE